MKSPTPPHEWLGPDSEKQHWTLNYLKKKFPSTTIENTPPHLDHETTLQALAKIWRHGEGAHDFAIIKRAWNSYSYRRNNKKRTYSFVLPIETAQQLKDISKTLGQSQSGYLTSLIRQDKTHIDNLKKQHQQKIERSLKARNSLVETRKTKELNQLRKENARNQRLLQQYEQLIIKLVQHSTIKQEVAEHGLKDDLELTASKRDKLSDIADRQALRFIDDAKIDASKI